MLGLFGAGMLLVLVLMLTHVPAQSALFDQLDPGIVVGLPDEQWGEVCKAFAVLNPGHTAEPQELIDHVKSRIARYKAPKSVEVVDELPKTSTGKVQKFELREKEWAAEAGRIRC